VSSIRMKLCALSAVVIIWITLMSGGCSGNPDYSLDTAHGTVNLFVRHILEEGDLPAAYGLLSQADRDLISANPDFGRFIQGSRDSTTQVYSSIYAQLVPDILEILRDMDKIKGSKHWTT